MQSPIIFGAVAWIIDAAHKNSPEYVEAHKVSTNTGNGPAPSPQQPPPSSASTAQSAPAIKHAAPKKSEPNVGCNRTPPPNTAIVMDNASKATFDGGGANGYSNGAIIRNGSHDLHFKDFTFNSAPQGSFNQWKQKLYDDAGDPQKVKDDLEWFRKQMEPVWASRPDIQREVEKQFQPVEDTFIASASDKDAIRKLLSQLMANPAEKPPQ